jgi:hypothetical protein
MVDDEMLRPAATTERDALLARPAPDARDASGHRTGLWAIAPTGPHPDARTTYVEGRPDGAFYWPGPAGTGWIEGILRPVDAADDALDLRVRADERGIACTLHGPSRAERIRTFDPEGRCRREAHHDGAGRLDGTVVSWDAKGAVESVERWRAGVPHGAWERRRGPGTVRLELVDGRVELTAEQVTALGTALGGVAASFADPAKLETALGREVGHHELLGRVLASLVRARALDPWAGPVMHALAAHPGLDLADVDAILDDPRDYPSPRAIEHLPGWPSTVDRIVARVIDARPLAAWLERARSMARPDRRAGMLFVAARFGGALTAAEQEEVALAMLERVSSWPLQRIAMPGSALDGPSLEPFSGETAKTITTLFGL